MAITSVGYAGSVDYAEWAQLSERLGAEYTVYGASDFAVTVGAGARQVTVAPGQAAGRGILDASSADESLVGGVVASGNRWDLVVLRRDWNTNTTSVVLVPGVSTRSVPPRETNPGNRDDQPIALVRFSAGQLAAQEIVDLRVWAGTGGLFARDELVRSFLPRVGTVVRVNGVRWSLDLVGSASVWVAGRNVRGHARPEAGAQAVAHNTLTVARITSSFLSGGVTFNDGADAFTVPVTGWYRVQASARWAASSNGYRAIGYQVNAVGTPSEDTRAAVSGAETGQGFTAYLSLTAGQSVKLVMLQTSGGVLNVGERSLHVELVHEG